MGVDLKSRPDWPAPDLESVCDERSSVRIRVPVVDGRCCLSFMTLLVELADY